MGGGRGGSWRLNPTTHMLSKDSTAELHLTLNTLQPLGLGGQCSPKAWSTACGMIGRWGTFKKGGGLAKGLWANEEVPLKAVVGPGSYFFSCFLAMRLVDFIVTLAAAMVGC